MPAVIDYAAGKWEELGKAAKDSWKYKTYVSMRASLLRNSSNFTCTDDRRAVDVRNECRSIRANTLISHDSQGPHRI